jgi:hypothetical protein
MSGQLTHDRLSQLYRWRGVSGRVATSTHNELHARPPRQFHKRGPPGRSDEARWPISMFVRSHRKGLRIVVAEFYTPDTLMVPMRLNQQTIFK